MGVNSKDSGFRVADSWGGGGGGRKILSVSHLDEVLGCCK